MGVWIVAALIGAAGAFGGLLNSLVAGEFVLPRYYAETKVFRPGWIGAVVVGSAAALIFWCTYGPVASQALDAVGAIHLTFLQFGDSAIVGISGSAILTSMAHARAEKATRTLVANIAAAHASGAAAKLSLGIGGQDLTASLDDIAKASTFDALSRAVTLHLQLNP